MGIEQLAVLIAEMVAMAADKVEFVREDDSSYLISYYNGQEWIGAITSSDLTVEI